MTSEEREKLTYNLREGFIAKVDAKFTEFQCANKAWIGLDGNDIPKLKKDPKAKIPEDVLVYMRELEAEAIAFYS